MTSSTFCENPDIWHSAPIPLSYKQTRGGGTKTNFLPSLFYHFFSGLTKSEVYKGMLSICPSLHSSSPSGVSDHYLENQLLNSIQTYHVLFSELWTALAQFRISGFLLHCYQILCAHVHTHWESFRNYHILGHVSSISVPWWSGDDQKMVGIVSNI